MREQYSAEEWATAVHEASHACAGLHFGLRVRSVSIAPPRGLTRFCHDASFQQLSARRRCLVSMAGPIGEVKFTGKPLCVPFGQIRDELRRLQRGESLPPSDTRNIASQLAREDVHEAGLADWLIDKRVDATLRLLDDLWPPVAKVAQALLERHSLMGDEVVALFANPGT